MAERVITIGGEVQPFWAAYTTAPEVPGPGVTAVGAVTQHGAGLGIDGYVDIRCTETRVGAVAFQEFNTSMRVHGSTVPLVSTHHDTDWFSCFSVLFSVQLETAASTVAINVTSLSNASNSFLLTIGPTKSTLLFDGATVDITSVVFALANAFDHRNTMTIDVAELHIIARRVPGEGTGSKAMFEIRCGFYQAETTTEIYRTTRLFKTTEMFRSSFVSGLGAGDTPAATPPTASALLRLFNFDLGAMVLADHAVDLAAEPEA